MPGALCVAFGKRLKLPQMIDTLVSYHMPFAALLVLPWRILVGDAFMFMGGIFCCLLCQSMWRQWRTRKMT